MKLFLGVDGGQSGTTAMIGDDTGRILGTGDAGPCNHAAAVEGRAKLERAITGSVSAACGQAGLDPASVHFEAACFGMSGGPEDKREILAATLRVDRLVVTNDAVIALAGATRTGQGIITIAGTGSIAFGRNPAGRSARAGGWGHIFGGEGGGVGTRLHRRGVPEPDPIGELPDVSGVAGGRALRRTAARSGGGRATRSLPECGTGVGGGGRRVGRWRWRGGRWLVTRALGLRLARLGWPTAVGGGFRGRARVLPVPRGACCCRSGWSRWPGHGRRPCGSGRRPRARRIRVP